MIRFVQRHRTIARLLPPNWLARRIWREALADPAFREGLERGKADFEAGRVVKWSER